MGSVRGSGRSPVYPTPAGEYTGDAPTPGADAPTMAPDDDDDDRDPLLDRRRRRKREAAHRRRLLLLGGLVLALGVVAWVAVAAAVKRSRDSDDGRGGPPLLGGPSATSEGETWTHKELAAYLRSRGLTVYSDPTERNSAWGPACEFRETAARGPEVHVQKWPDRQAAKDRSGGSPRPTFAWGRFCFSGEPGTERFVESMRAALGAR